MAGIFQRRHYERIAETIGAMPHPDVRQAAADAFMRMFMTDNGNFKPSRFMNEIDKHTPSYLKPSPARNEFTEYVPDDDSK